MNRAETLQQLANLCLGERNGVRAHMVAPSGLRELDAVLPGGGWRSGSIVELMPTQTGIGELQLLAPTLANMTRAGRHVTFIAPPYIPFAPALEKCGIRLDRLLIIRADKREEVLWSLEQLLRCRSVGAALAWPSVLKDREIRRLQLAAEAGGSIGFLYRTLQSSLEASPAAVRLRLQRSNSGALQIDVLKCRGARSGMTVHCATSASSVDCNADLAASL